MSYTPIVNAASLELFLGVCATGRARASNTTLDIVAFGTVYNPQPGITFTSDDVGMPIAICGGGPVDADMPPVYFVQGALFLTTIAAYVSPTQVTLTDAPDTSIFNTGFATVILYRPCPFASDVANVPMGFQFNSSIAPGTNDTLQFSVLNSMGGVSNPYIDRFGDVKLGQPVYLRRVDPIAGNIDEFGGYIDTLETSSYPGRSAPYCWSATCASWSGLARRRVVPPANPQVFTGAGDEVFRRLVLDYLSNDSVAVTAASAPDITLAAPVGANIGQLLDQVVTLISDETTAWYWTTDVWRTFILATRTATAAPWNVTNGDDLFAGDTPYLQSIVQTHNQMANFVYAIGQNTLLNTLNAALNGNGSATTFNLPEAVGASPTITLNAGSQTVGILGVDTGKNWYWSQGSAVITQDSGGTVLGPSDTLLVSFTPQTLAVAQSPNVGSLQSLQAIEGTSANYEHAITISQPILPADLLAISTAYETEYGEPAATANLYTLRPGLRTGQLQAIDLAAAGIPSGNYLIATVQMSLMSNVIVWQYTAFGGANIGDSITALVQFINRQTVGSVALVNPTVAITGAATPVAGNFTSGHADNDTFPPLPFPSDVTKGNLLVVILGKNNMATPPPITDSQGNTYTQAVAAAYTPGFFPNIISINYAFASATGPCSVSATTGFYTVIVEISGIDPNHPVDVTGSSNDTAPTLTVAHSDNVVVTGICMDSSAIVPTVTTPEILLGYQLGGGPASDCAASLDVVSAAGSFTSSLVDTSTHVIYASVSFNRLPATSPPPQTTNVVANPVGTVTHSLGDLTSGDIVVGNGGGDVKSGVSAASLVTGATTLTHANRFPKISSAGVLAESTITDTGSQVTIPEITVISTNASTVNAPTFAGTVLQIASATNANTRLLLDAYGATGDIDVRVANGTPGSPTNITSGQSLGVFGSSGYGSTGYSAHTRAKIECIASENWTDAAQGCGFRISTTPSGTAPAAATVVANFQESGRVVIGNSGADDGSGAVLQVHGSVNIPAGSSYEINGVPITSPTVLTTKGDILGYDTAPDRIPVGTNGQVLTADSTQSLGVKWSAAGGGAVVLVDSQTASSSAALNFTSDIISAYDQYMVELINVLPATNGVDVWLEVSTDNGSTYDTTSGHYAWANWRWINSAQGASGSQSDAKIVLTSGTGETSNSSTTGGVCGSVRIYNPLSGSHSTRINGQISSTDTTPLELGISVAAAYTQTTAVNAFRLRCSSGNIASGTVRVYGIGH